MLSDGMRGQRRSAVSIVEATEWPEPRVVDLRQV
jgi:hypothetical protein